ncbi:helix-turn-helix transcriptional regulator [Nocardioides rubriscoriae]|uniref:helix-turn-helix transcriptional regulator n=1 Tax=Nocardioides rubriscoriae TaxID=642762 RepID=UPI001B866B20|nr:helix-turn-helix transcriptional regulator [Nocardioides rubriscoriae]
MPPRRNATSTRAGILRPDEFARHVSMQRTETSEVLAPWVEYHWTLAWDLPDGTTYPSAVIPHPAANLSVEHGAGRAEAQGEVVLVTGVTTRRFDVEVVGRGWVHGVKLRPGGLVALTGTDAKGLVDRTVPARDVLPVEVHDALAALAPGTPTTEATDLACAALAALVPPAGEPSYDLLLHVVEHMLTDRSLLRADQVAERHGLSRRALERLFARYVGVGPKWVLARYRMHDVVTALDDGYAGSLADLAAAYGWFDQAHFSRDFTALVGVPPSGYRSTAR